MGFRTAEAALTGAYLPFGIALIAWSLHRFVQPQHFLDTAVAGVHVGQFLLVWGSLAIGMLVAQLARQVTVRFVQHIERAFELEPDLG